MQGRVVLGPDNQPVASLPSPGHVLGLSTCVELACESVTSCALLGIGGENQIAWKCNVTTLEAKEEYDGGCALRLLKNFHLWHIFHETLPKEIPEWVIYADRNLPELIVDLVEHGHILREVLSIRLRAGIPDQKSKNELKKALNDYLIFVQNLCSTDEEFYHFLERLPVEGFRKQPELDYFLVNFLGETMEKIYREANGMETNDLKQRMITYNVLRLLQEFLVRLNGPEGEEISKGYSVMQLPEKSCGIVEPVARALRNSTRVGIITRIDERKIDHFLQKYASSKAATESENFAPAIEGLASRSNVSNPDAMTAKESFTPDEIILKAKEEIQRYWRHCRLVPPPEKKVLASWRERFSRLFANFC